MPTLERRLDVLETRIGKHCWTCNVLRLFGEPEVPCAHQGGPTCHEDALRELLASGAPCPVDECEAGRIFRRAHPLPPRCLYPPPRESRCEQS